MRGVEVEMLVRGQTVRKIKHETGTYLPVREGDTFSLRVRNRTNEDIVAVVSVDGLSVMNGQPASHDDHGYVIQAWNEGTIDGYRRGPDLVKEFVVGTNNRFFKQDQTYAEKRTGSNENNGVIGVVIMPRKQVVRQYLSKGGAVPCGYANDYEDYEREMPTAGGIRYEASSGNESFESSVDRSPVVRSSVGTKMGKERVSKVKTVDFEPDRDRKTLIVLYYDTVSSLERNGILDQYLIKKSGPNPFPAEPDNLYCPDQ